MGDRSAFSRPDVSAEVALQTALVDCGLVDPERGASDYTDAIQQELDQLELS